jgi:hypothetical protein
MCGPSSQEEGLQASSSSFANTLQGAYSTLFPQQQATLAQLNSKLSQISSGETGPGFSGAEDAARTSQIVNQGAADARNVTQAVQDRGAGQVFGGEGDSSGLARTSAINKQVQEQASSAAAGRTSNALTNLTAENYAQGRENAKVAANGFDILAGLQNPTPYANEAISENSQSFGQADKINQEKNQMQSDIAGLVTGVAKTGLGLATGGISNLFGIGGGGSTGAPGGSDTQTGDGYYD